jgi:hypothetical protein
MFKKILGYFLFVIAGLIVMGNIATLPGIFKPNGNTGANAVAYTIGQITASVIMLLIAYFLSRFGRKLTQV